jgi:hypothetical protein
MFWCRNTDSIVTDVAFNEWTLSLDPFLVIYKKNIENRVTWDEHDSMHLVMADKLHVICDEHLISDEAEMLNGGRMSDITESHDQKNGSVCSSS